MNGAQRAVLRHFDDVRRLHELLWLRDGVWRRMTVARERRLRYYAGQVIAWGMH